MQVALTFWALALQRITTSTAFTLITFDVDGTLVRGGGPQGASADASAHSRAFNHACGTVLGDGRPATPPVAQALPRRLYHGSTDGLILLRLARATLGVEPEVAFEKLDDMMQVMYDYIASMDDEQVAQGMELLPGVSAQLTTLAQEHKHNVMCGLVTGNVEGIARRKMRAVGVLQTGVLAPPCFTQLERNKRWHGAEDLGFLGGFGSDYCSGNVDDEARNYLDRAEQIRIAADRCGRVLASKENADYGDNKSRLRRVVHVGDAPADVLAAKSFASAVANGCVKGYEDVCVGMVAVATGSYGAEELRTLAGENIPGQWECSVLEEGIASPHFFRACGIEVKSKAS